MKEDDTTTTVNDISGYHYLDSNPKCHYKYLLPVVFEIIDGLRLEAPERQIFDFGCGNGWVAAALARKGYDVVGVDPSEEGIKEATRSYPHLKFFQGSAYSDLASRFGQFPVVISLEVVEHVYYPCKFAECVFLLLREGGSAILSTPYHGYWKNLTLAITGKMDAHFTALWEHGHIKFWSFRTLRELLKGAGFESVEFRRVGRIPMLAKGMIAIARKAL